MSDVHILHHSSPSQIFDLVCAIVLLIADPASRRLACRMLVLWSRKAVRAVDALLHWNLRRFWAVLRQHVSDCQYLHAQSRRILVEYISLQPEYLYLQTESSVLRLHFLSIFLALLCSKLAPPPQMHWWIFLTPISWPLHVIPVLQHIDRNLIPNKWSLAALPLILYSTSGLTALPVSPGLSMTCEPMRSTCTFQFWPYSLLQFKCSSRVDLSNKKTMAREQ